MSHVSHAWHALALSSTIRYSLNMAYTLQIQSCAVVLVFLPGICKAGECASSQYLEMGETGHLKCSFPESVAFILWYNSKFSESDEPMVYIQESSKGGKGLESGEYDITNEGSLVIKNVSLSHEHYFSVAHKHPGMADIATSEISVIVTVKPTIPYTVIRNEDHSAGRFGFLRVTKPVLVCSVDNVRPVIPLTWVILSMEGDKVEPFTSRTLTNTNTTYSTTISTDKVFFYSDRLSLLACKADGPPGILLEESLVLVHNGNMGEGRVQPITKYAERRSRLELACSGNELGFLIWQKSTSFKTMSYTNVLFAEFLVKNKTKINIDEYNMGNSGTLIFSEVKYHHEGLYRCISGNGINDNVAAYEVLVYENPVPPQTVIEGCGYVQLCNLDVNDEGYLMCTIKGIRPKIQLEFSTFDESDSGSISFFNQHISTKDNGDTFDLTLTTEYRVRDRSAKFLAIECKVTGLHENVFNMTWVKVNLQFKREPQDHSLVILLIILNLTFMLILTYSCGRKSLAKSSYCRIYSLHA